MNVNDKISIEYEARTMIDENQYVNFLQNYSNAKNMRSFINTNEYFDTSELILLNNHTVLRKRSCNNSIELTLKIKRENGDLEITQEVKNNSLPLSTILSKKMIEELTKFNVDVNMLKKVGMLKTERTEIQFNDYLLVIDKNFYNNKVDYNIEIESTSKEKANLYLNEILKQYNITFDNNYINKARRAILKN